MKAISARKLAEIIATTMTVGALFLGFFVSSGQAAAGVRIRWSMSVVVDAGARPTLAYKIAAPHGDRAELQLLQGKHWVDAIGLKMSGKSKAPPLRKGSHFFRVAVFNRRGVDVLTTSKRKVNAISVPRVTWTLAATQNANASMPFAWVASKLPAGAQLVIQQREGTGRVWQTVMNLSGSTGSSALAGEPIGQSYMYRIAVLDDKVELNSETTSVNVFGEVPLTTLLNDADPETYTSPTSTFAYVFSGYSDQTSAISVDASDNDCISVQLSFIMGSHSEYWPENASLVQTVTVVQQSQNPVSASADFNTTGTVSATIIPGQSWSVNTQANDGDSDATPVYFNGYAVCDTTTLKADVVVDSA